MSKKNEQKKNRPASNLSGKGNSTEVLKKKLEICKTVFD